MGEAGGAVAVPLWGIGALAVGRLLSRPSRTSTGRVAARGVAGGFRGCHTAVQQFDGRLRQPSRWYARACAICSLVKITVNMSRCWFADSSGSPRDPRTPAGGMTLGETFETEDTLQAASPASSTRSRGLGGIKDKAAARAKQAAGMAASAAGAAANKAKSKAAHGIEEASKVKGLKKFMDLDLEVFSSTEEADRKEMEADLRNRRKWGGLLHPETTASVVYNQVHVVFLLYMAYVLPVRTAFMIDPPIGSAEFVLDVVIDLAICVDIFLNFHKVSADWSRGQG